MYPTGWCSSSDFVQSSPARITLRRLQCHCSTSEINHYAYIICHFYSSRLTIYLAISDTSSGKQARPEQAIKAPRGWRSRRQYLPDAAPSAPSPLPNSNEITHHLITRNFSAVYWGVELRSSNRFSVCILKAIA